MVEAEGLSVVLQALADGPYELSVSLSIVFLYVMDKPETRQYLKPGLDIEVSLSFLESWNVTTDARRADYLSCFYGNDRERSR